MDDGFSSWLRNTVPTQVTWSTKMSEVRRLENVYGDLDDHFERDGLELIAGELAYSSVDKRNEEPNPSRIPIDGDLYNNLSSYRSALRKYQLFCEERDTMPLSEAAASLAAENAQDARALGFRYEQDLQTALIACIGQIEPGMTLAENGKERIVASGRIDALAVDVSNGAVVIELKAVTAKREVLGQIAAYMADIEDETGSRPRGILIAPDFDPKLISGARMVDGLTLMTYSFRFEFGPAKLSS